MNRLPELAMRYRTTVTTCVTLLVLFGTYAFFTMPRREDPEFTIMTCVVTTSWPGASATKVEELVTDPLEEVLDGIEEVDVLRSTSSNGQSIIYVDLEDSLSPSLVDNVWDKVRARVAKVEMPEDNIVPRVDDEFGDTSVIVFAVSQIPLAGSSQIDPQHEYSHRELDIYSERVTDALRLLPGVAKVERFGVRQEAIYIETDVGSWSQLNLTASQLSELTMARNIIAPGGMIDTDDGRFYVKPGGELDGVREIDSIIAGAVTSGNMRNQVYLRDLGLSVRRDYEDPPAMIGRSGDAQSSRTAVMVALTMKSGSNIIDICGAAKQRIHQLQDIDKSIPPDVAITPISDQSVGVEARITEVIVNVIEAIVIVVVVVYLVVGFRTAAVMAANIPFVVIASVGLVTFADVQLEQISLASIIIALGLLVDNAVQVCDQTRTNLMAGMSPEESAITGARVLASPMLSGTLTTIAAFFPMLIAIEGGNREFIYSLPVTLSVTLGVSWILAMTFCVILAARFIRVEEDRTRPSAPIPRLFAWCRRVVRSRQSADNDAENASGTQGNGLYGALAMTALRGKWLTMGVACLLLVVSFSLPVGSEFFPQNERDQFAVQIWLPENASIEQTDQAAAQVEEILRKLSPITTDDGQTLERVRAMRTVVGGGGSRWYLSWNPEPRKPNYAEILVRTSDSQYTSELAELLRHAARNGNPERSIQPVITARVVPIELMLGPPADPVVLRVMGDGFADPATLHRTADRVQEMVRAQPETWNVHDSWGANGYELHVAVDEDRANLSGVTNSQIARTLNSYYSGLQLTTFREGDHQVPVYFRLRPEGRRTLSDIGGAFVEGNAGKVPLNAIAQVTPRWEPAVIERRDMNRVIEVRARVEPGTSGNDVVHRVIASDDMKQLQASLPPGFRVEIGGALEESQEASVMMLTSFGISFVVILLLLVFQYDSVAKTFIIIATLPLALIGALAGLWLTDNPLGFMPQLGVLSLFGIVLNTGIIFIEFADILIAQRSAASDGSGPIVGLTREEFRQCLVDAGRQRLLPIFLTTATTVGGLLPLALAGGPLWVGMAWLMICGLLVATLLTLFVVPALYAILVETFGLTPVKQ